MNLSLIDLTDSDSRTSDSPRTRTPTPSASPYFSFGQSQLANRLDHSLWQSEGRYGGGDLHSALNNIPKYGSQLSQQYAAVYSSQLAGGAHQLSSFLPQPAAYKERAGYSALPASQSNLGSLYTQTVPTGSALSQSQMINMSTYPQSSKYTQLLAVIEDLGKDIRPTYAGSKSSAERLKRGIIHARILVREAIIEAERSARQ